MKYTSLVNGLLTQERADVVHLVYPGLVGTVRFYL